MPAARSGSTSLGTSPPFVGRESELRALEDRVLAARRGEPWLSLIAGEAGVGKSRLAREVAAIARRSGFRVAIGRAYEGISHPYAPLEEALRDRAEGSEEERTLWPHPELAESSDAELLAPPEVGSREQLRFLRETARRVMRLARDEPTCLVIEDLHWGDRASLDLLSHLVFSAADTTDTGVPLLMLVTLRPAELCERSAGVVARLEREPICGRIDLTGLDEEETRRFVERLELGRPSHQLVRALAEATGGNPLFLREGVRQLIERGQLRQEGGYAFTLLSRLEPILPKDLALSVAERLRRLSDACRRLLVLAACLGERFEPGLLAAVAGEDEVAISPELEEAEEQGLLASEDRKLRFEHPLVRRALWSEPMAIPRPQIHHRIADALERRHADDLPEHAAEIAHHLFAAGSRAEVGRVVHYARLASRRALSLFAWSEAARLLSAASACADADGTLPAKERGDLHFQAGYLHHYDWDPAPCRLHYEQAARAYHEAGDVRGHAAAVTWQVRSQIALGGVAYGRTPDLAPLEEALDALGEDHAELRCMTLHTMSEARWLGRDAESAEELSRRALALAAELDDARLLRHGYLSLALAQQQRLRCRDALESWQLALDCARRSGDPWLENAPRQRITMALTQLGRLTEAGQCAEEGRELAQRSEDAGELSFAEANRAVLATLRGEFAEAERLARNTMVLVSRSRYGFSGSLAVLAVASLRAARGELPESEDAVRMLLEPGRVFDRPGSGRLMLLAHRALLDTLEAGPPQLQQEELSQLASKADRVGPDANYLWVLCAAVESAAYRGAVALVAPALPRLAGALEQGVVFTSGWCFLVPRVLALAAACDERFDEAEDRFEGALALARRVGALPELARTQLDFAHALAARDRSDDAPRAAALVEQAASLCASLGMRPHLRRARELAARLGVPLAEAGVGETVLPGGLSRREVEMVRRLAGGQREEEIAHALMLSAATVAQRMSWIFEKIGAEWPDRASDTALLAKDGPPPRVILVSDLEGFTRLVERLGDARAQQLIHVHNEILRTGLRGHRGAEITHTGDGIMASFTAPASALRCAIAMQEAFERHNRRHADLPLRVRIGLNAGKPLLEEGRLFGSAINAAVRICSQARPGTILASGAVRELVAEVGFEFTQRGPVALKGFDEPMALFELERAESAR